MDAEPVHAEPKNARETLELLKARLDELNASSVETDAEIERIISELPELRERSAYVRGKLEILGKIARGDITY
jgi:prefoldin subunit 5